MLNICIVDDWVQALTTLYEGSAICCIFLNVFGGIDVVAMSEYADGIPKEGMSGNIISFSQPEISIWHVTGYEIRALALALSTSIFEAVAVDLRTKVA